MYNSRHNIIDLHLGMLSLLIILLTEQISMILLHLYGYLAFTLSTPLPFSSRTKTMGTGLIFLHLCCFGETNIKIVYISDNLELINRNKEHLNYTDPYPNNTLAAEFDITEQIYLTNQTYNIEASFQHV